jgi:hypothetical protein
MRHFYFSSVGFIAGYIPDFSRFFDRDLSLKCQSYAYYTLEFLNRHVAGKKEEDIGGLTESKLQELTVLQKLK